MKWVLIDSSWIGHRARSAVKGLEWEGTPTGVMFGFFQMLLSTCQDPKVASNRVGLCFDSRQSLRKMAYPAYKDNRTREQRSEEEWKEIICMKEQLKRLRKEILPEIGIPCYYQWGLESDDVMASGALETREPCVMITADGDLYQCISQTAHWYDPMRHLYLDVDGLIQHKRVGPVDWAEVKCIAGCHGDNVAGIPGVGEKTAVDFLWKVLNPNHKRYQSIVSPEGQAVVRRNRPLIFLPHPATQPVRLVEPQYNPDAFFKWAGKLGFKSFTEGKFRRDWEDFFEGRLSATNRQAAKARKRGA